MIILMLEIIFALMVFYLCYQLIRNEVIYKIMMKWIKEDDERCVTYFEKHPNLYEDVFLPNKKNWYGFRYPKDSHFK